MSYILHHHNIFKTTLLEILVRGEEEEKMEYEPVRFQGVPNYGVRVESPVGHPTVVVLDLTDRSKVRPLPDSNLMGELTAYLCGAGARGFVYNLQGYDSQDAAERATGIAILMKRFNVEERYVGLDMNKVPSDGHGLIDSWRDHLLLRSASSIDLAVNNLLGILDPLADMESQKKK